MTDELFKNLLRSKTLFAGWHMTRRDVLKDFYLDDFGLEHFASNLQSHIADISRALRLGEYRFAERRPIAIPKGPHGTRPGSILSLRDRITLWAAISLLARQLDSKLVHGVRSFRVRTSNSSGSLFEDSDDILIPFLKSSYITRRISPFSPWHYNWKEFDQLSKDAMSAGYQYAAVTDIAAYFENINIDILRDLLLQHFPSDHRIVNLIISGLSSWVVETTKGVHPRRGIPQGTGISSFLGNVFLMPVDEALSSPLWTADTIYLRYMDDIRIFSRSKPLAVKALLELEKQLRNIHLSVQTAKTKVLTGAELRNLLYDVRIDEIKLVRDRFPRTIPPNLAPLSLLSRVASKPLVGSEPLEKRFVTRAGLPERATRMWMNSVMFYGSTAYIPSLTYTLVRNADPRYSDLFVRTAKRFPDYPYSRAQIYSYLSSPENIYEYHECQILEAFRYMSRRSDRIFERCVRIISTDSSYNLKLAATRYLAKWRMAPRHLTIVRKALERERYIPCAIGYIQILAQLNGVDFSYIMTKIGRIPSFQSVDAMEFVRRIRQFSAFTRSFLSFVFDPNHRYRLSDWIGSLWIMSHTSDRRLKRHLDGLARRRELSESDALLTNSLSGIRARLI